ncbi:hypothetical protein NCC49_002300 [Naganishia albida]|nr:hypothetical protein NCC49_002300 [Naganishia albida]
MPTCITVPVVEFSKGYLAFFQERIRTEIQHTENLQKLYVKTRAFDSLHDDALPGHLPPSRSVWREVRDHTEREVESRLAYVSALEETVMRPLQGIRDRQTKIKLRIKDDLKTAEARYRESAEHTVPKLKKAYFKKCQELEEQKRQDQAIALQAKLLAEPMHPGQSYSPLQTPAVENGHNPYTSPPTSTPPLPPSANPALVHVDVTGDAKTDTTSRKRSASVGQDKAKEVLNDLAVQGKKQINAFISRFGSDKDRSQQSGTTSEDDSPPVKSATLPTHNKGNSMSASISSLAGISTRDGLVYGRENTGKDRAGALKTAKLRREVEEADKAYRAAVFDLESYRLNINKIVMHANETLSDFVEDFSQRLAQLLTSYTDATTATSSMNAQSSEHSRKAIKQIQPSVEAELYVPRLGREVSGIPHILYENYYVGPCHSLIFGVSLTAYDYQREEIRARGIPPTIVLKCIAELDRRGLDQEGIHRISGRQSTITSLVQTIELDEEAFEFSVKEHDVFSISSVLKQYCRELPEPIFPLPQHERQRYTENRELHIGSNFSAIRAKLAKLPPIHQNTFRVILEHLSRVAANASKNKMDAKNLAVIWATALFGEDELPKDGDLASFKPGKDTLAEDLITFVALLFGETDTQGPVLPPHAALTRSGSLSYDAQHERLGSGHTRAKLPSFTGDTSSLPPRLPPRPNVDRSSSADTASPLSSTISSDLQQLSIKGPSTDKLAPHSAARSDISHTAELSIVPEVTTTESSTTLGLSESTAAIENYAEEDHAAESANETPMPAKATASMLQHVDTTAAADPEVGGTHHTST